jgi:hypothetical protein
MEDIGSTGAEEARTDKFEIIGLDLPNDDVIGERLSVLTPLRLRALPRPMRNISVFARLNQKTKVPKCARRSLKIVCLEVLRLGVAKTGYFQELTKLHLKTSAPYPHMKNEFNQR